MAAPSPDPPSAAPHATSTGASRPTTAGSTKVLRFILDVLLIGHWVTAMPTGPPSRPPVRSGAVGPGKTERSALCSQWLGGRRDRSLSNEVLAMRLVGNAR